MSLITLTFLASLIAPNGHVSSYPINIQIPSISCDIGNIARQKKLYDDLLNAKGGFGNVKLVYTFSRFDCIDDIK